MLNELCRSGYAQISAGTQAKITENNPIVFFLNILMSVCMVNDIGSMLVDILILLLYVTYWYINLNPFS